MPKAKQVRAAKEFTKNLTKAHISLLRSGITSSMPDHVRILFNEKLMVLLIATLEEKGILK